MRSLHQARTAIIVCVALSSASMATAARADDAPPAIRRSSGGSMFRGGIAGTSGIRPVIGVTGHLDVARPTIAGGNKFVFGVDYLTAVGQNLALVLAFHVGAGGEAIVLNPIVELTYRFALPIPLVPYVGGGAGLKLAFASGQPTNLVLGFRFVSGLEFFFSPTVGVGMELALPDLGPRLTPDPRPVGTVEWTIGPHFRL